jgi:hypothetical protein
LVVGLHRLCNSSVPLFDCFLTSVLGYPRITIAISERHLSVAQKHSVFRKLPLDFREVPLVISDAINERQRPCKTKPIIEISQQAPVEHRHRPQF